MADLARRHEARGWSPRAVWKAISDLEDAVAFLRKSRDLVGKATFPAGVIPPTALQQPATQPGLVNLSANTFALSTTHADLISATITVPAGYTAGAVTLVGRVYGVNSTASAAYLFAQVKIGASSSNAVPIAADAAGGAADGVLNVAALSVSLTGLTPGGTFTVALSAWTDAATWTADPSSLADLSGQIVWFA